MPVLPKSPQADQAPPEAESQSSTTAQVSPAQSPQADVLVAGSLAIDLSCDYAPPAGETTTTPASHTSNPAMITQSLGGVGYNVAIASHYLGRSVLFCSVIGDDLSGRAALSALQKEQLPTTGIRTLPPSSGARTAQYIAVNDARKDLVVAMADMGIMEQPEQALDFDTFWEPMVAQAKPQWVVVDANWSPAVLAKWVQVAKAHGARVAFEPVSNAKSRRLFGPAAAIKPTDTVPNHAVGLAAPNQFELTTMYTAARENALFDSDGWWHVIDAMGMSAAGSRDRLVAMTSAPLVDQGIPQQSIQLLPFIPCLITKLGPQGVLVTQLLRPGDRRLTAPESAPYIVSRSLSETSPIGGVYLRLFPPAALLSEEDIVSVNGAGDTLLGAVVAGLSGDAARTVEEVIPQAQEASVRTLQSAGGVSREIKDLQL